MKPGSWTSIFSVFLFGVLGASTVSKLVPLSADLAREFGASPANFGWLISLIGVPAALLAIPSGLVVDRFGSRRVLSLCAALGILANIIYTVAPSYLFMQIARLVEGVAIVHIYTAAPAFLMATTDGKRRATSMTIWATYMPIGTAVGLLLAGRFAGGANWRLTFAVQGVLFLLVALINLRQPPISANIAGAAVPTLGQRLLDLRGAYSRPALLLLALAFFLMISLGFGANTTFPGYFARIHEVSISSASNVLALATLLMIPGSLLVGVLVARGVSQSVVFTGLGVVGTVVGSLAFYPDLSIPMRSLVVGSWFVISGASIAALLATLPLVAEPQRRGAAAALINQAGATATFVNPPIWLPLAAAGGWLPFAGLMVGGWLISVVSVWGLSAFSRRGRAE
jgi:predicted MFS family arabinose efflux permease